VACQAGISVSQARTFDVPPMHRMRLATAGLFVAWMPTTLKSWPPCATHLTHPGEASPELDAAARVGTATRRHGTPRRDRGPAVGLIVAAASVCGYRTKGRSAFYQNALLGFGPHGLGHLGTSLLAGGYASGVATAPMSAGPTLPPLLAGVPPSQVL
jgi:hypothetical protein